MSDSTADAAARVTAEAMHPATPAVANALMVSQSLLHQWGNPFAGKPGPFARAAWLLEGILEAQPDRQAAIAPVMFLSRLAGLVTYDPPAGEPLPSSFSGLAGAVTALSLQLGDVLAAVERHVARDHHVSHADLAAVRRSSADLVAAVFALDRLLEGAAERGGRLG